jgi:hypothetical protein
MPFSVSGYTRPAMSWRFFKNPGVANSAHKLFLAAKLNAKFYLHLGEAGYNLATFMACRSSRTASGPRRSQNLIASVIFSIATFLVARAIYRARLTDKDRKIEKARLGEQKALQKAETVKAELAALKQRFDEL